MNALLGLLFLASPPTPDSPAEVAVRSVSTAEYAEPARGERRTYLFGGRVARLSIDVHAGRTQRVDLRARLVQLGSNLAAPISEAIAVASNEEIGPGSRAFALRLVPPAVRRSTNFELQFTWRIAGERNWHSAGKAPLTIHPADLLQPLRSLGERRTVIVLDEDGRLAELLRRSEVKFLDVTPQLHGGASPFRRKPQPDSALAIWARHHAGEWSDTRRTLEKLYRWTGTVVVAGDLGDDAPALKLVRAGDRTRVDVHLPLHESLTHDPLYQSTLIEAILLSISPDPTTVEIPGGTP